MSCSRSRCRRPILTCSKCWCTDSSSKLATIHAVVTGLVQVSFHGTSGTYPRRAFRGVGIGGIGGAPVGGAGHAVVEVREHQLKSVPPTAVLNGVEARPLTERPYSAGAGTPLVAAGVAACGGRVTGGDKDRDAFGSCGLPEVVVLDVTGGADAQLALAVADVHDASSEVVDDVALGVVEIVVGGRVWIGRNEDDLGLGSDRAGPLDVEGVLEEIVEGAWSGGIGKVAGGAGADGEAASCCRR